MELAVALRTQSGKRNAPLRKLGIIPGVVYWRHTEKTISVSFPKNEFLKLYRYAGSSTVVDLTGEYSGMVLIHDIQTDPISNNLLHVDFLAVSANETVKAEVPVVLIGESPLVKANEGRVELVKDHIAVSALPKDLPHNIEIDISSLATVQDGVFVRDLQLWSKVEILEDDDQPIVVAVPLGKEEEEEVPAPAAETGEAWATPAPAAETE